jgi:conjugative relaxase-like TrwC/TraI family protein
MLSISKMSAGQGKYYMDLAREDYYLEGGEPPGQWWGRGAEEVGLTGAVDREQLANLFEGLHPAGTEALVQVQHFADGRTRQPGWDLTFSAPKSVSIVWSQGDDALRRALEAAHDKAVRQGLEYLESNAGFSRRGHGGEGLSRVTFVAALFEHGTSRAQDPQLHTHALLLNIGRRLDDGSFGTLRSRDVYLHKMAAGEVYKAALAHELRVLGFGLERTDASLEIAGVSRRLIEHFSKRRAEIEAAMSAAGVEGPRAAEFFTLSTRKVKEHVARDTLFAAWREAGHSLGLDVTKLPRAPQQEFSHEEPAFVRLTAGKAISALLEQRSFFYERDLMRSVLEQTRHRGLPLDLITKMVDGALCDERRIVTLPPDGPHTRFTTREMYQTEERLLGTAEALIKRQSPVVSESLVAVTLDAHRHLTDEQRNVVRALTQRPESLQLVEGLAGTGKTSVLRAASEAWRIAGFEPVGCALAAKAKAELSRSALIGSLTAAKLVKYLDREEAGLLGGFVRDIGRLRDAFFKELRAERAPRRAPVQKEQGQRPLLTDKSVLVIDEAGMLGTRMLEKLLSHASRAGARVVMVGDSRQLQPIDAGGPFKSLVDRHGATQLTQIVRQEAEWMRTAVREFAEGDSRAALTRYAEHGRFALAETRDDAMRLLVARWAKERPVDLADSLFLTSTRHDAGRLNALAQAHRLELGELTPGSDVARGEKRFFPGDRVLLTRNDARLGVFNGDFGRVITASRDGTLGIELDRRQDGRSVLASVNLGAYPDVDLGYAATTHKAQGSTVQDLFVLAGGPMQDRELTYVQMSRHRGNAFIVGVANDIDTAFADLVRSMGLSHQKLMAHDLASPLQSAHAYAIEPTR